MAFKGEADLRVPKKPCIRWRYICAPPASKLTDQSVHSSDASCHYHYCSKFVTHGHNRSETPVSIFSQTGHAFQNSSCDLRHYIMIGKHLCLAARITQYFKLAICNTTLSCCFPVARVLRSMIKVLRSVPCKVSVELCWCPLNVVNVSLDAVLDAAFTGMLRHHRPAQNTPPQRSCEILNDYTYVLAT